MSSTSHISYSAGLYLVTRGASFGFAIGAEKRGGSLPPLRMPDISMSRPTPCNLPPKGIFKKKNVITETAAPVQQHSGMYQQGWIGVGIGLD